MKSQQALLRHLCELRPSPSVSRLTTLPVRCLHSSRRQYAAETTKTKVATPAASSSKDKMLAAQARVQKRLDDERKELEATQSTGSLAASSIFSQVDPELSTARPRDSTIPLAERSASNMAQTLNPRPNARARWQRRMVIRHVQHGGRLTKEMKIARTERSHLSRSHFFKTSMKKLAPLARQIAGKTLDQAILQMRFSKKKVAKDVQEHLLEARYEAITAKGMGLKEGRTTAESKALISDPSQSRALPYQTPIKTFKDGHTPDPTTIYISEAWVNRGQYKKEPDFRARGRLYIKRPPHAGISVVLKEEKTRTRLAAEKEAKALRKRMGKNMWVQLPDRKITTQRQHLLW